MTRGACVLTIVVAATAGAADTRHSGFDDLSPATQAIQRDDAQNPGMLWVGEGEALWNAKAGPRDQSCASCHGDAAKSMRGVATRYPAFDEPLGRPIDLSQRINLCRTERQGAPPLAAESHDLVALEAFVAHQSRGLPIAPPQEARLASSVERGRTLWQARIGQLDLSCSQCHDDNPGRRVGGSVIPQGHPTGYPVYRLEWQSAGSLQRRLRGCIIGVRAEPYPYGAPELIDLELYLMYRAAGLAIETPAVRP
jgi:L-cysteine S-thiosulfotransferase